MKHNLPAPSQAWGSDIDRRIALLESKINSHENKVYNTASSISTLTQQINFKKSSEGFFTSYFYDGINHNMEPHPYSIDWAEGKTTMLLTVAGFIRLCTTQMDDKFLGRTYFKLSIDTQEGIWGYSLYIPQYGNDRAFTDFSYAVILPRKVAPKPQVKFTVTGNKNLLSTKDSDISYIQANISGVMI